MVIQNTEMTPTSCVCLCVPVCVLLCVPVCVCVCTCAWAHVRCCCAFFSMSKCVPTTCMWRTENYSVGPILSFHSCIVFRDQMQVIKLLDQVLLIFRVISAAHGFNVSTFSIAINTVQFLIWWISHLEINSFLLLVITVPLLSTEASGICMRYF